MENKINIAELLKDCPSGMELYSPIYGLGILTKVTDKIHVKFPKEHNVKCFRADGKVSEDGEIMIFPKGKTTWEEFQKQFKDEDIIETKTLEKLIKSKFDITSLKPHESRVLIRGSKNPFWKPAIFGSYSKEYTNFYVVSDNIRLQCIPYEGNEVCLGTTD